MLGTCVTGSILVSELPVPSASQTAPAPCGSPRARYPTGRGAGFQGPPFLEIASPRIVSLATSRARIPSSCTSPPSGLEVMSIQSLDRKYEIRDPSGDHEGHAASTAIWRRSEPSAFTTYTCDALSLV
jgi:hypothetical protein